MNDEIFINNKIIRYFENNYNVLNETQLNNSIPLSSSTYDDPWLELPPPETDNVYYGPFGINSQNDTQNTHDRLVNDNDMEAEAYDQNNIVNPAQAQDELLEEITDYVNDEQDANNLIANNAHTELNSSHNRATLTSNDDVASTQASPLAIVSVYFY